MRHRNLHYVKPLGVHSTHILQPLHNQFIFLQSLCHITLIKLSNFSMKFRFLNESGQKISSSIPTLHCCRLNRTAHQIKLCSKKRTMFRNLGNASGQTCKEVRCLNLLWTCGNKSLHSVSHISPDLFYINICRGQKNMNSLSLTLCRSTHPLNRNY